MSGSVEICNAQELLASLQSMWNEIGNHLEGARRRVQDEITHYPSPIPACDADFNHLLEQRARIGEELNRMRAAAANNLSSADCALIEEFIRSSNYLDDAAKQEIRLCLDKVRRT